jgi:hypothetical protein
LSDGKDSLPSWGKKIGGGIFEIKFYYFTNIFFKDKGKYKKHS